MKIERVTLHHLRMPLVTAFETSFGREVERECIILTVESGGLTGIGECVASRDPGYSYETTGTAWHILRDFIGPQVIGAQVRSIHDYRRLVDRIRGHQLAKAGLEMALWDLFGKMEGKPLYDMLGGERRPIEVGVSVGLQETPAALVEVVRRYVEEGYARIKIKIKPRRDVADSQAVRAAFPAIRLQVDANSAFDLETARTLRPLDELDLLLIEQPLFEDDIWDHRKLQAEFRTPICLDESIVSPRHARYALEMKACRIINIKAARLGGLSQAVEVHDLCRRSGMPVWCGGMLETGVGRAANLALASLPGFTLPGDISASDRYYNRDITRERFKLDSNSMIDVPTGPGLGISLDESALSLYTLAREVIGPQ
jgi:O-succinylbenzoate synthase